ncbi:lipopolysaccharide biosynthesis protein [Arcticibacter tournemirensis]
MYAIEMFKKVHYKLASYLKKDDARSQNIIRNILMSFGVKGGSILVGLILMPLTISYINPVQYGIWLTISSIVSWMSFFDIGMGNGLRNRLAESLAVGRIEDARKYVSTTYAIMTAISMALFLSYFFLHSFINWNYILNIPPSFNDDIDFIILVVVSSFCVQFVVQLINTVLIASHEPAKASVITFIGQLGVLIVISIVRFFVPGSLSVLVWILTFIPVLSFVFYSIYHYRGKWKNIAPSFKLIDIKYSKDILNIGGVFFFIQIGALVLFQTDNIIITRVLGPEYVTTFNVAYKLFSVITLVYTILITPYWSAFTDAYIKRDFEWIRGNIYLMRKWWVALSILALLLLVCSKWIFSLWLGEMVVVSMPLSIAMTIYVIVYMWQGLHVSFLNGAGKIKLQLYLVTISAIINIPLAIFLGKKFGVAGVISANTIVFIVMGIIFSLQVEGILKEMRVLSNK